MSGEGAPAFTVEVRPVGILASRRIGLQESERGKADQEQFDELVQGDTDPRSPKRGER